MSDLAWSWVRAAGGCDSGWWSSCQGKDLEDPCYGKCISDKLDTLTLLQLTNTALGDLTNFPNWGIRGDDVQGIQFWGSNSCLELSGGNSAYGQPIDLWDCNGLVNQAWYWAPGDYQIELAGHNLPGMCIDLPGGSAYNGNPLWLWGCNGGESQQWEYDSDAHTIHYKADPTYCIDVPGGDTTNGNQLWLWECNGGSTQEWYLIKGANGAQQDDSVRRSRNVANQTKGGSWMHEVKKALADVGEITLPDDWEPWYEKKEVKDWYAAQRPAPGVVSRPRVPLGWTGYPTDRKKLRLSSGGKNSTTALASEGWEKFTLLV